MQSIKDIMNRSALTTVEQDRAANDAADELMTLMLRMDIYMIEPQHRQRLQKMAGGALANRFVFACRDDNPDDEEPVWVFMPLEVWAKTGLAYTLPCPIEHLLPPGAFEIADGTWLWPDSKNKTDRALALMAQGFIWDPAFQHRVDNTQSTLTQTIARLNRPPAPQP
ncbi:MAG: hypothetical protein KKA05_02140 [Alphaproteobacteria bacterium]|nr:hypothetical protein [Alphaproteobacteria bacterium]MBU0859382.1 hypothetical protein [Alphaproteobacteria bacterium]